MATKTKKPSKDFIKRLYYANRKIEDIYNSLILSKNQELLKGPVEIEKSKGKIKSRDTYKKMDLEMLRDYALGEETKKTTKRRQVRSEDNIRNFNLC